MHRSTEGHEDDGLLFVVVIVVCDSNYEVQSVFQTFFRWNARPE